jgi:ribonuclease HI
MAGNLSVTIHIDGGSRGNPGPAGAGVVLRDGEGAILYQGGLFLGRATNNVAEYSGLLAGLKAAADLKASQVRVVSDSELLVRQMNGQYRVKNEGLKPLYEQAKQLAAGFARCAFQHVRRELNKEADHLANQAMDARRNVEDAQQ